MQILGRGVFPKYVKYNTFLSVLIFSSILSTGEAAAIAHTLNGSNDVLSRKDVDVPLWG